VIWSYDLMGDSLVSFDTLVSGFSTSDYNNVNLAIGNFIGSDDTLEIFLDGTNTRYIATLDIPNFSSKVSNGHFDWTSSWRYDSPLAITNNNTSQDSVYKWGEREY
jgi:hypothetical protein